MFLLTILDAPIVEVATSFMKDAAHLRLVGSATALCGASVAGYFIRKFFFITQVGGKHGCKECRDKYAELLDEDK